MLESPVTRLYLHEFCIILVLIINIHVQSAFISCPCTYPPTPGTYRWMVVVMMNNSEPFILITNITEEFANESFVSGNWCVFDLDPHLPARERMALNSSPRYQADTSSMSRPTTSLSETLDAFKFALN